MGGLGLEAVGRIAAVEEDFDLRAALGDFAVGRGDCLLYTSWVDLEDRGALFEALDAGWAFAGQAGAAGVVAACHAPDLSLIHI